ncbi:hypothetical protein TNCV_2023121 [Trichonephila clavipes]|nr:hypothetical protein TNCV_2023121 [Trichonephila clavipes]
MQGALRLLALTVALRFTPTPSLRHPLATLFFVEAKPPVFVKSLAAFLRLPRFPKFALLLSKGERTKPPAPTNGYYNYLRLQLFIGFM